LNYEGDVVASCIHCHQIGDARRNYYWTRSKPIPEKLLFPFPHPKSIGLVLDPARRARIKKITEDSPAENSKLRAGDDILTIDSQPMLSMADVQWVLHNTTSNSAELPVTVKRGTEICRLTLTLPAGWRRLDDPRWRVSSWGLGRMMTGGMRLKPLTDEERAEHGISSGMALKATHVGKYGQHATARRSGFREDDIVVEYDGRNDLKREADLFAYANGKFRPGDKVQIKYLRGGRLRTATLAIQE
jgi:S1-C subfamily serine protease